MSSVEMAVPATMEPAEGRESAGSVRGHLRFFRNELRLVFFRRRNQLLLAVVALFPLLIGVGLKAAAPNGGGGGGEARARAPACSSTSSRATACSSRSSR